MSSASAADALQSFGNALERIPAALRKTLTYDQGKEMSYHAALTLRTGVAVYFADSHSPWQRGSNENMTIPFLGPTGSCASTCPRARTCRSIARTSSTRSRSASPHDRASDMPSDHRRCRFTTSIYTWLRPPSAPCIDRLLYLDLETAPLRHHINQDQGRSSWTIYSVDFPASEHYRPPGERLPAGYHAEGGGE